MFIINIVDKLVAYLIGISLLLSGQNLETVFIAFFCAKLIAFLTATRFYNFLTFPNLNIKILKPLIISTLPLFLLTVFSMLYFRIDTIMIKHLSGLESVGSYTSAYRLMEALLLIPALITKSILPSITYFYKKNDTSNLSLIFQESIEVLFIIGSFALISTILYANQIMAYFYGNQFIESGSTLVILIISAFVLFINYIFSHFLFANHKEKFHLKILVILSLVNILMNFLLIPAIGINGAAFATLLCEIIALFAMYPAIELSLPIKKMIKISFISLSILIIFYFLKLPFILGVPTALLLFSLLLLFARLIPYSLTRYLTALFKFQK